MTANANARALAAVVLDEDEAVRPTGDGTRGWSPLDLSGYLDGTHVPPVPELLRRADGVSLLYPARVHWLSAEPEAGKSWLALLAASQVLMAGGRVLFIDLEDSPDSLIARLVALGVPRQVIGAQLAYVQPSGPLDGATRTVLTPLVAAAALVVVDACTAGMALQGLSPAADVDVAAWLELLPRWAARLGPAVLVVDHVVKSLESRGRWATGSQHKMAGLDGAAYGLEAVSPFGRNMTGRSRLTVQKDRSGQVRPHAVRMAGAKDWVADLVIEGHPDGSVTARLEPCSSEEGGPFRPTKIMGKVTELLGAHPEGLSLRGVQDRVGGRQQTVRQALAVMVDEGAVEVVAGTRGSHLHVLPGGGQSDA